MNYRIFLWLCLRPINDFMVIFNHLICQEMQLRPERQKNNFPRELSPSIKCKNKSYSDSQEKQTFCAFRSFKFNKFLRIHNPCYNLNTYFHISVCMK